jgi:hypothetical protein
MASTATLTFKNKAGDKYHILVRSHEARISRSASQALKKRGVVVNRDAAIDAQIDFSAEMVERLVESVTVERADGSEHEATKQEKLGVLGFSHIREAIIERANALESEENAEFVEVSGNSEPPSGSPSA